jgi:hypothetical protein
MMKHSKPYPSDVADGTHKEDVRLLLRSELLVGLGHPQQCPPRLLWLLAKRGYLEALLGLDILLDLFSLGAGEVKLHCWRRLHLRLGVREIKVVRD